MLAIFSSKQKINLFLSESVWKSKILVRVCQFMIVNLKKTSGLVLSLLKE